MLQMYPSMSGIFKFLKDLFIKVCKYFPMCYKYSQRVCRNGFAIAVEHKAQNKEVEKPDRHIERRRHFTSLPPCF